MDKSLAALVKTLANDYACRIEKNRFNGVWPKTLHVHSLRHASDAVIDLTKFNEHQDTLSAASLKDLDSKNS